MLLLNIFISEFSISFSANNFKIILFKFFMYFNALPLSLSLFLFLSLVRGGGDDVDVCEEEGEEVRVPLIV